MSKPILIGEGRNRQVFRHGNYVYKFPLNEYGVHDNNHEAHTYRESLRRPMYCKYARCKLVLPWATVLVMEYARYPGPLSDAEGYIGFDKCPEWAYSIDCCQVGYDRRGQIVAYDYGIH